MYKYLLFDLDETLLDFKMAEAMAIKPVLEKHGFDASDENIALYSKINESFWKRFEKGEIERQTIFEGRFEELSKILNNPVNPTEMNDDYFSTLSQYGILFPEAEALLDALKEKYVLAAVTNGALRTQINRIKASGLEKYFGERIFISEAVGLKKPNKEYFDYVLNALGNPKREEVLVLGDSVSSDIIGAFNSGLDCVMVRLRGQQVPKNPKPTFVVESLMDILKVCGL